MFGGSWMGGMVGESGVAMRRGAGAAGPGARTAVPFPDNRSCSAAKATTRDRGGHLC